MKLSDSKPESGVERPTYASAKTGKTEAAAKVALKGPVPPIRRTLINGQEYCHTADLVAWLDYVADGVVNPDADAKTRAAQHETANIIRILTKFTSQILHV